MKIAIDISQVIYGTGVSVYTRNLVTTLVKQYPDDEFILFGGSLRRRTELENFNRRLKSKIITFPLPPTFLDLLWNSFHIYSVEKLIGQVDVIHTSDWAEPPSKLPKVTTVHDLIPFKYPQTTAGNVRTAHRKRMAWVSKESKMIMAVSESTKKDLQELFNFDEDRIAVTPEGVDEIYQPQPPDIIDAIKRKYHLKGDYLFTLSTLEPRKNMKRIIEAFKLLKPDFPNLQLIIGGRTGWGEPLAPAPGVILPGYVPDADLPALYSGSLAFCLPSLYEGFGLPHLEAMSCGTAVVGSNLSSMPEVIGNAGVLVDPENIESIAAGIYKAIRNRAAFSKKAIARAELFTWSETARLTHEVYEKVAKL